MTWVDTLTLLVLCALSSHGWLAHKCVVYDDAADWPADTSCPGLRNSASCHGVTDIWNDLRDLPPRLQKLCVYVHRNQRVHGPLPVDSFSGLPNLQQLHISGCFSRILNGSFRGLSELRTLTLKHLYVPLDCCEAVVVPSALLDLPRLRTLYLHGYSLRKLTPDVWARLPQLAELSANATCDDDLAELVCRVTLLTSLTELTLSAPMVQELKRTNCSSYGGTERGETSSATLTTVRLSFGLVTTVDPGALSCFPELTYLSLQMMGRLREQLNKTAIRKIEFLDYGQDEGELSLEEICSVVSAFFIKRVDLHYKRIDVSDFDPDQCRSLEGLSFLTNSVSPLSLNCLYNFTNLRDLAVEGHTIHNICMPQLPPVKWLTKIRLEFSFLGLINRSQLSCFTHLTALELVANAISDIEDYSFATLGQLRYLRLSFNNISVIREHTFSGLTALETLHLTENPLLRIEERSFKPFINLQVFILRTLGCPLTHRTVNRLNLTSMFGRIPANLTSLTIFLDPGSMSLAAGGNSSSSRRLALRLVSSSVIMEDCHQPFFQSVVTFLVASSQVLCGFEFVGKYMRNLETFEFWSDFPPRFVDLSSLNALTRLRRLRLQNVDLLQQPAMGSLLHNLSSLRTLILFNCSISYLGSGLTRDLKSLTGLLVKSEDVMDVSVNFVQSLPSLRYLLLQRLELYCSCDNAWLVEWAKDSEVEVVVSYPPLSQVECLGDGTETEPPNFLRYAERECFSALGFFFFVSTSLGVVVLLLGALLRHVAGPYILPLYHILSGWLAELGGRGGGRGRSYSYDAFVSYSERDEPWVVERLLPSLEERRGPPFLRLCLHSRDFQLGKDVVENITDSLYRSRRTLCLVSRHFLRSNWCSLEMRLATYRLQVERRDMLILVFLERIPSRLLSAHHRLARLVKTTTYVDWPQDLARQEAFWDRLWTKLAPASE